MVSFGGKKVGQVVTTVGGNGVGHVLAAVAAALLLRFFSGPGPALSIDDAAEDEQEADADDGAPDSRKIAPVTIRWRNVTCSLSDKSPKPVSVWFCYYF